MQQNKKSKTWHSTGEWLAEADYAAALVMCLVELRDIDPLACIRVEEKLKERYGLAYQLPRMEVS